MYHYRKLKCLLLMLLVCTVAKAQLKDGKVYNFVNIENAGKSMTARTSGNYLTIATTDESDYSQLWYADEVTTDVYTLRNLGNGKYLRSPNANGNANWTCVKEVEDNAKFTWSEVDGNDVLRASNTTNGSHYLHYGSSTGTIVCWSTTAASQWTFTEVSVSDDDLADNWEVLESIDPSDADLTTFQTALNNLFTDKSCTELAKTFKSESEITADTDYNNLPTALQEMVMKVYNDSWTEDNGDKDDWDASYAKKYRVQLYEPHNEPEAAATALGINAHTNLNNPTGIYADTREALYVMVGGTIKEGASLYLASYTGNGRPGWYGNGVELHEGLNVIPSFVDGNNYCINYVVHTFDTSDGKRGHKAKARKLSDYEDLKIHIEGGHINGYYNKMGDDLYTADKNADWDYIEARATQTTVTILGEYITLQFPLNDAIDNEGNSNKGMSYYLNDLVNVEDVIEEWDNVMVWERLVLGLLSAEVMAAEDKISPYSEKNVFEYTGNDTEFPADYGDYYNVRGLSLGVDHNYMYGSWEYCGYHYNTMGGVIQNIPTNAGSHWGPGHEIGHQHQALLTVNGLMEVTNNLFSNVVLWYFGETTSRYNGDEGALSKVLEAYNTEGSDFFTNNIWAQTIMYYKLFLYYHVLGHNTKFYPRLFEMLRQDPMSGGYYQSGATSILHFYKKCCLAAGEDLTEFFRAHGFFEVMENRLVGDYSNSEYTQSQEDIDAAIAEVKALKYKENIAVLFINDATGGTILSHKGDTLELYGETTICATSGSYATFTEDAASADYTCEISGNTVTMSGTGGVGFAIFNEDGELIGFSDKSTFEISSECAVAIMEGTAEIKAMNSDNTVEEIEYDEASVKAALLGGLLEDAAKILAMSDSENKKPGFYKSSALTALQTAYNNAVEVYDSKVSASYSTAYETLYREYTAVKALTTDKVPFLAGSTYVLTNKKYPGYSMAINDKDTLHCYTTNLEDTKQQWTFEPTGAEDTYYLKNVSNSKYLRTLTKSGRCDALAADTDAACPYKLFDLGDGLWALQCQNDVEDKMSLHCDEGYKTVGWFHTASDNDGSWWYLTATTLVETDLPRYELEDLITKTEALMAEVGRVVVSDSLKVTLTTDSYYCNARCINTQWDQFSSYEVLCDGDNDTYLHTDYSGDDSEDELAHYIRMDVGENNSVQMFKITYTTRNYQYPLAPTSITVEGSNDLNTWYTIVDAFTEGLPKTKGTTFTSPTWGNGVRYRYVRFMVNNTITGQEAGPEGNKHKYFALSELGLLSVSYAEQLNSTYASIASGVLLEAFEANLAAQGVLATATTSAEYETAYEALETKYNALLEARKAIDNAALTAKKTELQELIDDATSLISSCGSVTYTTGSALTLSTTAGDEVNYLTAGPNATPSEGALENLIDTYSSTSFTSNWDSQTGNPYLQVQLPDDQALSKFTFTFTARDGGGAPTPSTIVVSGSNDGQDFATIATFTKDEHGFPAAASGEQWTSPEVTAEDAYKYLRFTVTKSERSSEGAEVPNGYYHFGISEFGLGTVGEYVVDLGTDVGDATEELVLAAYLQNAEAQSTYTMATTISQVEKAIAKLQADYDALNDAKNSNTYVTYTVQVTGGSANGGVIYNEANYVADATFEAPINLTTESLTAIALDGYVAKSITIADRVVTVTYNKVYTVQVTGGGGNGGVTFGEQDYADDATFDAEQASFTAEDLTAIVPDGYTLKEVTVDHETGVISVSYAAIPLVDTTKYYTLACKATDHDTYIRDLGTSINGRSAEGSLFQFEAADEDNGYYIKSYVSEKYLNCTANDNTENDAVVESEEKLTVWKMVEPSHTDGVVTLTAGYDKYLNNNGDAPTYLLARYHNGGPGSSNACSLWTLTEGEPLDMSDLATLINETNDLIASCYTDDVLNYVNSAYVTEESLTGVREVVADAQAKYESKATVASEYNAAMTALQEAKDNLASNITLAETEAAERENARNELLNLIEQTNTLIEECGTVTYGVQVDKTLITLQTTDENADGYLYCNAPYLADSTIGDYSPASEGYHILDTDYTTYLHTDWSENAPTNEDHYLRVSLGSIELSDFVLMYSTRGGGGDIYPGNPKKVVVEGCATADGEYTEIAVLTSEDEGNPLPQGSALSHYTSAVLDGTGYKYIRFRVTENQSNSQKNGHCWFYISEFSLASAVQTEGWSVTFNNGVGRVTEEQLIAIYQKNDEATELANTSYDKTALDAAKDELQSLYDALAFAKLFPVELTTDASAPVLYTIKTKRDGAPVLQYETGSEMLSVVTAETGKATQAFYFMRGDNNQVYIYPYMADGKVLAANDVDNGDSKALAMEKGTATYEQWVFVGQAEGYYNLQPANTSTYLSNIYGTSHKMGFYSSNPDTDQGSLFKFEPTTVEGSYYYLLLKDYYETQAKVASSEIQGGSAVGYYPAEQATTYNTAYAAATDVLASDDNTDEAYQTAYDALVAANEALVMKMPEEGKFYVLQCALSNDYATNALAYAEPSDNKMYWATNKTTADATAIWTFTPSATEGKFVVTNMHTGTGVNGFGNHVASPLVESGADVSIKPLSGDGQVGILCNGTMMHAQSDYKAIVHWEDGAGSGSAWRIVEVEDMSLVKFSLTITQYRHAGLYLDYATAIPEGVKVYIAHSSGDGYVIADELEGTILPARTAAIVKGEEGSYDFKYTANPYDGADEESFANNVLGGSAYLKYQQIAKDGNRCCIFGQKSGEVGLYKNWVAYSDANGTLVDTDADDKPSEDDGTYFKISANKIYFEYEPTAVSNASAFLFRLNDKDETTELDRLIMADDTIIYNLYGQRLNEVVVPGFYIINGKKIYVDEKMINNKK